jgi:hypothetical protein
MANKVAEKLIPRDYPFGTKRVPLESGYYDVYNCQFMSQERAYART